MDCKKCGGHVPPWEDWCPRCNASVWSGPSQSSTFNYHVFRDGETAIFNSTMEERCPLAKFKTPSARVVEGVIRTATASGGLDQTYKSNFEGLAKSDLLADKTICGYHLVRAMVLMLFELNSGFPGDEYRNWGPAFHTIIDGLVPRPERSAAEYAHDRLEWLVAAATEGVEALYKLMSHMERDNRKWAEEGRR
jgi:hypothetical protein